jgi:hypothetical protein
MGAIEADSGGRAAPANGASDQPPTRALPTLLLYATLIAGAAGLLALRIWLMLDLPLWLDETWTAMIAGQPTWRTFWHEVWLDANAPFYYLLMALWPADGNFGLRLPSLLFMIAVPLLVAGWRAPGLAREARLTWAALLFFWGPGLFLSADARGYALLLLVSAAQTIAYVRLIEAPDMRRAIAWCGLAALAVWTHYFAAWPALVQGLVYVALHRGRAVRTFPALLVLAPLAAWGAWHLPRLLVYARPDVVWYDRLAAGLAAQVAASAVGPSVAFALILAAILAACRLLPAQPSGRGLRWAAVASLASLALLVTVGMERPFLIDRYLTPLVPGLLLGIVLLARSPAGYTAVAAWYFLAINPAAARATLETRARFGLEMPTAWLLPARPDTLTYAIAYPGARVLDPGTMAKIGGHFFEHAGRPVKARMIVKRFDPTAELLAAATGERPAIILLYGLPDAPDARRIDPKWHCRDLRGYRTGVLACAPRRLFEEAGRL